jgi:hypothetical protein
LPPSRGHKLLDRCFKFNIMHITSPESTFEAAEKAEKRTKKKLRHKSRCSSASSCAFECLNFSLRSARNGEAKTSEARCTMSYTRDFCRSQQCGLHRAEKAQLMSVRYATTKYQIKSPFVWKYGKRFIAEPECARVRAFGGRFRGERDSVGFNRGSRVIPAHECFNISFTSFLLSCNTPKMAMKKKCAPKPQYCSANRHTREPAAYTHSRAEL